jgi:hypothetical protein
VADVVDVVVADVVNGGGTGELGRGSLKKVLPGGGAYRVSDSS